MKKFLCLAFLVPCVGCAGGVGFNANVNKPMASLCQPNVQVPDQPTPAAPTTSVMATQ